MRSACILKKATYLRAVVHTVCPYKITVFGALENKKLTDICFQLLGAPFAIRSSLS